MASQTLTSCNDSIALVVAEAEPALVSLGFCAEPPDTFKWQDRDYDWDGHFFKWDLMV